MDGYLESFSPLVVVKEKTFLRLLTTDLLSMKNKSVMTLVCVFLPKVIWGWPAAPAGPPAQTCRFVP